jgi:vitamin B12 transporter
LIYTPKHKLSFSSGYQIKDFSVSLQALHNGRIYTSSDNKYELGSYQLINLGLEYSISNKPKIDIQLNIDNLFNKEYQSLPSRIMPGRSYRTTLTLKF